MKTFVVVTNRPEGRDAFVTRSTRLPIKGYKVAYEAETFKEACAKLAKPRERKK